VAEEFNPKLIGYLCNWCCYAGADLAGVSRIQYPPDIRIIRVMCSSRIEPAIILEMFIQGADGVFIGGCHPGDCHYIEGNYHTPFKIDLTQRLLEAAGINPVRLRLEWVSASEAIRFAELMKEMSVDMRELGPSPVSGSSPDMDILEALAISRSAANDFRLRLLTGKAYFLTEKGNVYDEKIDMKRYEAVIDNIVEEELLRQKILRSLINKSGSVKDIARDIEVPTKDVLEHLVVLKDRGLVGLEGISDTSPIYSYLQKE
jgi:coenzyme F420-reducing hydrogenase delta subunit